MSLTPKLDEEKTCVNCTKTACVPDMGIDVAFRRRGTVRQVLFYRTEPGQVAL